MATKEYNALIKQDSEKNWQEILQFIANYASWYDTRYPDDEAVVICTDLKNSVRITYYGQNAKIKYSMLEEDTLVLVDIQPEPDQDPQVYRSERIQNTLDDLGRLSKT